jgi:hypothetical protein
MMPSVEFFEQTATQDLHESILLDFLAYFLRRQMCAERKRVMKGAYISARESPADGMHMGCIITCLRSNFLFVIMTIITISGMHTSSTASLYPPF